MPSRRTCSLLLLLPLLLVLGAPPGRAAALPVLALDLDPAAPGVQATRSAAVGSTVDVEVLVLGLDATTPLEAFQIALDFDPLRLAAAALSAPVGWRYVASDLTPPQASYASVSLTGPRTTDTSLAVFTFDVLAPGTAELALSGLLSDPDGEALVLGDGSTQGQISAVPEPSAALLAAFATSAAALVVRRRA